LLRLKRNETIVIGASIAASLGTWALHATHGAPVTQFVVSVIALGALASVIGFAVDHLATRVSASVTAILQSALGNLPELFICLFALRDGLVQVVQTALIGSILGNSLLVLGLAFFAGGLRNGRQIFLAEGPRAISIIIAVAAAALMIPSLAVRFHTPAGGHASQISVACAVILLLVFAGSLVHTMRTTQEAAIEYDSTQTAWPLPFTIATLLYASVAAVFVSDWFVDSIQPTIALLGITQSFTGLVIVAIAGNAVENYVGVTMAVRNRQDLAIGLILNSSLQIAVLLIPALVLLSRLLPGGASLTLVFPPMLVIVTFLAAVVPLMAIFDGESNWLEGLSLIGLYAIIAASFWWG
jgi:Ca2+:H+ antiporter